MLNELEDNIFMINIRKYLLADLPFSCIYQLPLAKVLCSSLLLTPSYLDEGTNIRNSWLRFAFLQILANYFIPRDKNRILSKAEKECRPKDDILEKKGFLYVSEFGLSAIW